METMMMEALLGVVLVLGSVFLVLTPVWLGLRSAE